MAVICRWDTLSVWKCKLQNIHRITVTEHFFCYATKVLWQCGPAHFCLPTHVLNRIKKDPVHQICMQKPHCQVPPVAIHALSHWLWYDIITVGQRECISSDHFSEGCLSRTRTVHLVIVMQGGKLHHATHADLMEAVQLFTCVVIGIHARGLAPTTHV